MANSASSNELHSITKHNNIVISGVGSNEVLKFDGSNWINQTLVEAGIQAVISSSARLNANLIHDGSVSNTEFGYISTLASNAQTQLTAKAPISSPTFTTGATSPAWITGNSGTVKFNDSDGSHYFTLAANATTTTSIAYTWPVDAGTDNFALTTNGAGVLTWEAAGSPLTPWTENIDADTFTLTDVGATGNNWDSSALVIQSTTNAKLRLVIGSGDASIVFEGPTNWAVGLDNSASDQFVIGNDTALGASTKDRLTIATGGDVTVSTGNLVIGTAGKGIDFSDTTNASETGAAMVNELLDDYEEGTFTPVVKFGDATTGTGYTEQVGRYTKIGNRVLCHMRWALNNKGSATGNFSIHGLPFSVPSGNIYYVPATCALYFATFTGTVVGYTRTNGGVLDFVEYTEAGGINTITNADFANNTAGMFAITYYTG